MLQAASEGAIVCHLSFDHRALDPAAPSLLVAEIERQVLLQVRAEEQRARHRKLSRSRLPSAATTTTRNLGLDDRGWESVVLDLAGATRGQRVQVVFDTLEAAQRRDWELSSLRSLADLCARSGWNVICSGRAAVAGFDDTILLDGLPREDAVALLQELLGGRGAVDDMGMRPETLPDVIDLVTTSPLCIRLAAGILKATVGEVGPLRDLDLSRGAIEGELYRRFLGHIDDPAVRRLAYPGLALRRITPEIIQQVLARPCKVRVGSETRARELFDVLASEAMLVERRPDGTVVHRSDIRHLMLHRLESDAPAAVRSVHRAAIRYYRSLPSRDAFVEEIYHRLMLGQKPATLDGRVHATDTPPAEWVARELLDAIDDVPPASRAYLADLAPDLGVSLSRDDLAAIDDASRRPVVERQVRQLVAAGDAYGALSLLRSQATAHGESLLPLLELQVLEYLGRLPEALALGRGEESRAARRGDLEGTLAAALHCARLLEQLGQVRAAGQELRALAERITRRGHATVADLSWLRLAIARLRLQRFGADTEGYPKLAAIALAAYEAAPPSNLRRDPALLRDLAAELGPDAPTGLVTAALDAGQVTDIDGTLTVALHEFDDRVSESRGRTSGVLGEQVQMAEPPDDADVLRSLVAPESSPVEAADQISKFIKGYPRLMPTALGDSLTRNFRIASDTATAKRIELE